MSASFKVFCCFLNNFEVPLLDHRSTATFSSSIRVGPFSVMETSLEYTFRDFFLLNIFCMIPAFPAQLKPRMAFMQNKSNRKASFSRFASSLQRIFWVRHRHHRLKKDKKRRLVGGKLPVTKALRAPRWTTRARGTKKICLV